MHGRHCLWCILYWNTQYARLLDIYSRSRIAEKSRLLCNTYRGPPRAAAWKYYPTILLPATLMGFPWRLEKNNSRQKYIDFREKNSVSCQRVRFENRMQSHRSNWCKQTVAKSSLACLLCYFTFSQVRAIDNQIFEKGVRCSKVKLGTSAILCEIINALIYQKKHRREVVKITS